MFKLIWLLFFVSCALRVDYKLPNHRFMDPETRGTNILNERSWFLTTHLSGVQELELSSVSTNFVFPGETVSDNQAFESSVTMGLQAGMGIVPFLDLHYRVDYDAPGMLIAKLQLLGGSAKEASAGHKLALWGGLGSMSESDNLTVSNEDGSTQRSYDSDLSVRAHEMGVSYGYRFTPLFMTYLNLVHARFNANSILVSPTNPNVIVQGMTNQNVANLGIKFGYAQRVFTHVELGYSQVEWRERERFKNEAMSFGATFGIGF